VFRELQDRPEFLAFQMDEASRYRWQSTRLSLERFLRLEVARLRQSSYAFHGREISFDPEHGNAVPIRLPSGEDLYLVGRIDRLDLREIEGKKYALVLDYKRSPKSGLPRTLREGKDLQLVAYLLFVRDVRHWTPAGGLYLPVLPPPRQEEDLAPAGGNPLRLRAQGIFLEEEREAIDGNTGLLAGQKGGSTQARKNEKDLGNLLDLGRAYLASYAATQRSGRIPAAPLEEQPGRLPCGQCDFGAICRFRRERDPVRRKPAEGMLYPPAPEAVEEREADDRTAPGNGEATGTGEREGA
jgi:ATP-dependent helicase/nuclease subunit B